MDVWMQQSIYPYIEYNTEQIPLQLQYLHHKRTPD